MRQQPDLSGNADVRSHDDMRGVYPDLRDYAHVYPVTGHLPWRDHLSGGTDLRWSADM